MVCMFKYFQISILFIALVLASSCAAGKNDDVVAGSVLGKPVEVAVDRGA